MPKHINGGQWPIIFIAVVIAAGGFSCRSSPTGPHISQNVQLSVQYAACTEVWLTLTFSGGPSGNSEFRITRDGDTVLTGGINGTDTVVTDTTVQAERTYTYKAYRLVNSEVSDTSGPLEVSTMDSTSHDFSWQTFQFGAGTSSYLYDVSIVNDTDVWAVGAIYVDSADGQPDPYEYNVIRWDGNKWNYYRIYYSYQGGTFLSPNNSVFAFNDQDVWTGSTEPMHWNGSTWVQYDITSSTFDGYALKFWGRDSSDLYMVGDRGGAMAHYDGYRWQKIQTGTTLPIQDIWGEANSSGSGDEVVAIASDWATNNGMEMLQAGPNSVSEANTTGLPWSLYSIWSPDARHYFVCGNGVYRNYSLTTPWRLNPYQAIPYTRRIRGNGVNDFVIAGDFGLLAHYNGSTTREYNGNELQNFSGEYNSVDMKGNMIVAVGWLNSGQAVAAIGKR